MSSAKAGACIGEMIPASSKQGAVGDVPPYDPWTWAVNEKERRTHDFMACNEFKANPAPTAGRPKPQVA